MLAKLITLINNEILQIVQIVLSVFFGVLLIADSYRPAAFSSGASRGSTGDSYHGFQVEPFSFALGVALIVVAFLIYRKWSSGLESK